MMESSFTEATTIIMSGALKGAFRIFSLFFLALSGSDISIAFNAVSANFFLPSPETFINFQGFKAPWSGALYAAL